MRSCALRYRRCEVARHNRAATKALGSTNLQDHEALPFERWFRCRVLVFCCSKLCSKTAPKEEMLPQKPVFSKEKKIGNLTNQAAEEGWVKTKGVSLPQD